MSRYDHPLWRRWTTVRQFKLNPNDPHHELYKNLDVQGLDNFEEFCSWIDEEIGPPPTPKHRLNRIDQYQGWVPGNVRWAVNSEISNNRRYNIRVEYQGENLTLAQWAKKMNMEYHTLFTRYEHGWTPHEMFTIGSEPGNRKIVRS